MRIDVDRLARDLKALLRRALSKTRSGQIIADSLLHTARNHVKARYPGSRHWSPDRIQKGAYSRDSGSIDVGIAGADRAYRDITILPRRAKYLTIPLHSSAYGRKAGDIDGLFRPKDRNILAKAVNGRLVAVFALAKRAFQKKDPSLLPSDETFASNISERWTKAFFDRCGN